MSTGEVCEHGSLKRQCLICELQVELAEAQAHISQLTEQLAVAGDRLVPCSIDWCKYVATYCCLHGTPGARDGGKAERLERGLRVLLDATRGCPFPRFEIMLKRLLDGETITGWTGMHDPTEKGGSA